MSQNIHALENPRIDSTKVVAPQNLEPAWSGFVPGPWMESIDTSQFIEINVEPYLGDASFLEKASEKTQKVWAKICLLMKKEAEKGILDADTKVVSGILSHKASYIDEENEVLFGLQTDAPLKRALMPYGGIRMSKASLEAYGYELDPEIEHIFTAFRKTHNQGVFQVYTQEMKKARKSAIITGLPDAYGRGRIIGDYRRVALYGVDRLIQEKKAQLKNREKPEMDESVIREREEYAEQIQALEELKQLGSQYGFNLAIPAANAKEAVQWVYLAYLGAVKEQNGAAMSFGRVSTFLDIYFQRDLRAGIISETQAQELIDQLVIKLRIIRFARTPDYNALFSGDPTWVTESIGGLGLNGTPLVTRSSFRILQTLYNLGPAPEPNLTVLWSQKLPQGFKRFCAKVSIETSSVQYENDDLMRPQFGSDYGIACCVSAMQLGKQMQFFGARANLAKALLYSINGGQDEVSGEQIAPKSTIIQDEILNYDQVMAQLERTLDWLTRLYVQTLNVIHYMHDKYSYERLEMALHDDEVERKLACGIAGLSVVADSLSAIRYAQVRPIRNEQGLAIDFNILGEFPKFGNNDPRVDQIAAELIQTFSNKLKKQKTYRNSTPTMSVLTITSNVVYGKKTGNTPDGRQKGQAFAPGANPMHGRDMHGALASLASVSQLPYENAADGISNTFSIIPQALGRDLADQQAHLMGLLDGYFKDGGHHLNVNVFNRATLEDAMEHPENYPQLTIRVSGYAVNFIKLSREQQIEVINRTFHASL